MKWSHKKTQIELRTLFEDYQKFHLGYFKGAGIESFYNLKIEAWRNFLKDGGGGFFEDQRVRKDLKLKTFPESKKSLMISMKFKKC